ncbi:hypothetical protein M0812_02594 [Anaeramoeba flamelloides]|uniref:Uncharacterized protein n=1 Tax=Anaeramoeba flamelloides TaxID=1746091 RepID=A0AAV7YN70_9EUKA|nr:hypothetical protein M0812_02594 [Anaeramoeba flamelloides]
MTCVLSCSKDSECTSTDNPKCNLEKKKCVECLDSSHCSANKYCYEQSECKSYSDDKKFGEFCQTNECKDSEDKIVCGKCDGTKTIWEGTCLNHKCEQCSTASGATNKIIAAHLNTVKCYPKGVSGYAGVVKNPQFESNAPKGFKQNSLSIAFFVVGFFLFFFTVMQCLIMIKVGK